jgi:hypothetical protein
VVPRRLSNAARAPLPCESDKGTAVRHRHSVRADRESGAECARAVIGLGCGVIADRKSGAEQTRGFRLGVFCRFPRPRCRRCLCSLSRRCSCHSSSAGGVGHSGATQGCDSQCTRPHDAQQYSAGQPCDCPCPMLFTTVICRSIRFLRIVVPYLQRKPYRKRRRSGRKQQKTFSNTSSSKLFTYTNFSKANRSRSNVSAG